MSSHHPIRDADRAALVANVRRRLRGVADDLGAPLALPEERPGASVPLIGRVADPEPLMRAEEATARQNPAALLRALGALALIADSRRVVLAVREDLEDLHRTLTRLAAGTVVQVVPVAARYPRDDDNLRCEVAEALDRRPSTFADAPVHGAVVLQDVALALDGQGATERWVSVAGAVASPTTRPLPLGSSVEDAIAAAGGATTVAWVCYENGLHGGHRVEADQSVDLDTRALLVVPAKHPRALADATPLGDRVRQGAVACQPCQLCSESCPVWLTRGGLQPHLVMRQLARSFGEEQTLPRGNAEEASTLATLSCIGCGVCSLACPASLDPARIVAATAAQLREAGLDVDAPAPLEPHEARGGRLPSFQRLAQQLAPLNAAPPPLDERPHVPRTLALPLSDPRGQPRAPLVTRGDEVRRGELLSRTTAHAVELRAPRAAVVEGIDPDQGLLLRCRPGR